MISIWPMFIDDWRRDREGDRVGDILRLRQLEAVDEALPNFRDCCRGRERRYRSLLDRDRSRSPAPVYRNVDAELVRQHCDRGLRGVVGRVAAEVVIAGD